MNDAITIETDMYEHREVKPHFINPCSYGEDLAARMKRELSPLVDDGFTLQSLSRGLRLGSLGLAWERPSGWPYLMSVSGLKNLLRNGWLLSDTMLG